MNRSPYKGLVPFDEEDAPFFFGREEERDLIIANLVASRLTLLYGATGVGKSSVLGAGVMYHLHQIIGEHRQHGKTPEFAIVSHRVWRKDAVPELINRIQTDVAKTLELPVGEIFKGNLSLSETIETASSRFEDGLMIILDQFESFFLYHDVEVERAQENGSFAVEFPKILNRPDLRANFLISIREDALARLDCFKGSIPRLFDNYMRIEHLDRWDAYEAVTKPIAKYSELLADGEQKYSIDPKLVDAVLNQVATGQVMLDRGGAAAPNDENERDKTLVEAPFLQLVMDRLWDEEKKQGSRELRLQTLERLGGAQTIIQSHLEQKLQDLTPQQRESAARIFRHLVTRTGVKIMHTIEDLASESGLTRDQVAEVVDRLSSPGFRILRQVPPPPDMLSLERYEISHDILARAARDWRRKQEQAESERRAVEEAADKERQLRRELERDTAIERAALERRRRKELFSLFVVVVVLLIATIVLAILAVRGRNQAKSRYFAILSSQVQPDQDLSVLLANEAVKASDTSEAENALRASLFDRQAKRTSIRGHTGPVYSGSFSPDGQWIVTAGRDTYAILRRISSQQPVVLLKHAASVRSAAFSSDGNRIVTASEDGAARLWVGIIDRAKAASDAGQQLKLDAEKDAILLRHPQPAFGASFSPDGTKIVTACWDDDGWIWDITGEKPKWIVKLPHTADVYSAAFNPDAKAPSTVVTSSKDGTARVWDVTTGAEKFVLRHGGPVWHAAYSHDGTRIATASEDKTARVWDSATGQLLLTLRHLDTVRSASFSPDGRWILTASDDRTVRIWDSTTGHLLFPPMNHNSAVLSAEFSPDGKSVVAAGIDRVVRIWEEFTANPILAVGSPTIASAIALNAVAFSPDGKAVVTGGADYRVRLWNTDRLGSPNYINPEWLANAGSCVNSVSFSPDGSKILVGTEIGVVRVLDRSSGQPVGADVTDNQALTGATFSPDGNRIITVGHGAQATIWDASTRQSTGHLKHEGGLWSVAYSNDGKLIITGGDERVVRIWNSQTNQVIGTLEHVTGSVRRAIFSRDDQNIITGTVDGSAFVWPRSMWGGKSKENPRRLGGHSAAITSLAFSKDGKWLLTASNDGTVRIWETDTWTSLFELRLHGGGVNSAMFDPSRSGSPFGERVVTAGEDGTSLIYTCESCAPLETLRKMVGERIKRELTDDEKERYVR